MKSWYIAKNELPEYNYGTVYVCDEPFYIWALGKLANAILFPKFLMAIPLPNWFSKPRDPQDDKNYSLKEWYGSLGDVWYLCISDPIFQYYWKKHRKYEIVVEIGYPKLKQLFTKAYPNFFVDNSPVQ